jgi:hypothetical protein
MGSNPIGVTFSHVMKRSPLQRAAFLRFATLGCFGLRLVTAAFWEVLPHTLRLTHGTVADNPREVLVSNLSMVLWAAGVFSKLLAGPHIVYSVLPASSRGCLNPNAVRTVLVPGLRTSHNVLNFTWPVVCR